MSRESGNYPPGAEFDPNAPWNEVVLPDQEFKVTVSLCISKTMTVETNDYNYTREEDWEDYDTTDTDFESVVRKQHYLPHTAINKLKELLKDNPKAKYLLEDLEGWFEDDFEVNIDD